MGLGWNHDAAERFSPGDDCAANLHKLQLWRWSSQAERSPELLQERTGRIGREAEWLVQYRLFHPTLQLWVWQREPRRLTAPCQRCSELRYSRLQRNGDQRAI